MNKLNRYWVFILLSILTFNSNLYAKSKSKKAPVFDVVTLDDDSLTIGGASDKVTVLNFWATWCAPCIAEIPSLNELVKANADGVIFIAITDESGDMVQKFFNKREIKFLYHQVVDRSDIADAYKANKNLFNIRKTVVRPVHIVIDKKGNVVFHKEGATETICKEIQSQIDKYLETE